MKNIISILMLLIVQNSFGQFHTKMSRSELGLLVGASCYLGDLNPIMPYRDPHLAAGVVYRYNVHSRLSMRLNFTYAEVSADDANSNELLLQDRNLNFSSTIYELAAGVEFNYFPFQLGHDRYKGTAYILAEIGVFRMNPKTNYNGAEIELRQLGTEGQGTSLNKKGYYSLTQLCIPIGVGAKLSLGDRFGLNFEIGIRKTFTDYLDDVGSNSYVNVDALAAESGPLSAELSNKSAAAFGKRGDASTKDWYLFSGVMITFRLGKPTNCW